MPDHQPSLLVTGAGGQLGRLVIQELLKTVPAAHIAAMLRSKAAGSELDAQGVRVLVGDYSKPETLDAALAGIDRVLLISSEIPEILANADRIVVFRRGRIAGEVAAAEATQEALVHLAS